MGAPLLTYSMTVPGQEQKTPSVQCSKTAPKDGYSGQLSIVELTLTGVNNNSQPVTISEIEVKIPGADWNAQENLVADPSTIVAIAGDSTPWAVSGDRDGRWWAFPLPPAATIPPGGAVSFSFSGIVVNLIPYTVEIPVFETSSQGRAEAPMSVVKTQAVGPFVTAPKIESFTVEPGQATRGQDVTIQWKVAGMDAGGSCQLSVRERPPGRPPEETLVNLSPAAAGTTKLPIRYDAIYKLKALNSGGSATAEKTVAVMPVAIASFTATPRAVKPSQPVTLAWQVDHAVKCSIDNGVGEVGATGPRTVTPAKTTIYTLEASNGEKQVQRSVTVTVEPT